MYIPIGESKIILNIRKYIGLRIDGWSIILKTQCHCSACGAICAIEEWRGIESLARPWQYTRIIFGTHEKIYSHEKLALPIFAPVYFCRECSLSLDIISTLVSIIQSFNPPYHWIFGDNTEFDPERGCWITIWPIVDISKEDFINVQIPLQVFEDTIEGLSNVNPNPFQIFKC